MGPLAISLLLSVILLSLAKLLQWQLRPYRSPLSILPGPPTAHWLFGWFFAEKPFRNDGMYHEWVEKYGTNLVSMGMFRTNRLLTVDFRALNHVLSHSADYQKPVLARNLLSNLLSNGILITEGDQHKQQRRVMNPAFGPTQIRDLTNSFVSKAIELANVWSSQVLRSDGAAHIDVVDGLSRMTLDVIGLAGFGYHFNALNETGERNELNKALQTLFSSSPSPLSALQLFFPILRDLPTTHNRQTKHAKAIMNRIGMQLVQEKKAAILASGNVEKKGIASTDLQDRDLLSLLIKANMASDIPESQRMSDEDVLAQVPTFLVAGHETTSMAVTWCLFDLSRTPYVQAQLREEVLSLSTGTPSMDELNELPYLDSVIRETLRIHGPVPMSVRTAMKDDIIPVMEPFLDKNGQIRDHIKVTKGDEIIIPILLINTWKKIWGEDANEFRPERWGHPPEALQGNPGVWSHMLTFLGGPRACIGYRFSLVEMKALLFTLVRTFEFALAVPQQEIIVKHSAIMARPMVTSEREKGIQMPLIVRLYKPE